jgi:hypothetical protein
MSESLAGVADGCAAALFHRRVPEKRARWATFQV